MSSVVPEKSSGVLSGFALKWISLAAMVLYGTATIVLLPLAKETGAAENSALYTAAAILEMLGCVYLPISCFLAAEGGAKSHSCLRYAVVLLLFAALSEMPFSFAYFGVVFRYKLQNPLFTLSAGVFAVTAISLTMESRLSPLKKALIITAASAALLAAAWFLNFDGSIYAVSSIIIMYALRNHKWLRLLGLLPFVFVSPWCLLSAIPLCLYSGERGRGVKYFHYYFYPVHLLVLTLIARIAMNVI